MDNDARVQKMLWITIPYIQDDQTWCVATARPQDLWKNIFSIYTIGTWLTLIAAIFFNALIIYLLIRVENKNESYVWTLMIGMASIYYWLFFSHEISQFLKQKKILTSFIFKLFFKIKIRRLRSVSMRLTIRNAFQFE